MNHSLESLSSQSPIRTEQPEGKAPGPLSLMSYNIHRWAGRDGEMDLGRLATVIRASGADFVGLNEVLHPVMRHGRMQSPLAELARRLDMHYAFGPSGWMDEGPHWRGPQGNAMLCRYPLAGVANTPLPGLPGSKARAVLGATFDDGPYAGMAAFVTHLDHALEPTRMVQLRGLLTTIRRPGAHFVVGDFNTPGFLGANSSRARPPVVRMMEAAGYQDAFRTVGHGNGRTFPSVSPMVRIDYLFMPWEWACGFRAARTVDLRLTHHASDHRPLLVAWDWPETACEGPEPRHRSRAAR